MLFLIIIIIVIIIIKIVFIIYSSSYKKRSHSGIRDHLMVSTEILESLKNGQQHARTHTPTNSKPPEKEFCASLGLVSTHTQRAVRLSVIWLPVCSSNVGAS